MDITLQRILSLIPKKENGDFEHGALKNFAKSIGLKSGNLISDWKKGRSKSYLSYIYEISTKYNVSVEWLRGETDEKNPAPIEGEKDPILQEVLAIWENTSESDHLKMLDMIRLYKGWTRQQEQKKQKSGPDEDEAAKDIEYYEAGECPEPGTYLCCGCQKERSYILHENEKLSVCPVCNHSFWMRINARP